MKRTNTAVWIESRNRWQINVQKDGVRKTFTSSKLGKTGQREANAKADKWLDEGVVSGRLTVKKTSEDYIEYLKSTTSKSNWVQYEGYFKNWINPQIGTVKIDNLSEMSLQKVINNGVSKGLSKKTLMNIRGCMMGFLKYCRKSKFTTLIVEDLAIPKGAPVGEKCILQPEHIKILFASDKTMFGRKEISDPLINAYRFQVVTGLRPGELFGLKWADINDDIVHLRRSINELNEITNGKNENARRDFALNAISCSILEAQKALYKASECESEYVFARADGSHLTQPYYYDRWRKYRMHNGITANVSPYELRHTFVSAVKTLPEGYLKQLVGHSKSMDTYGVYSHKMTNDMSNTARMVQDVFKNILAG